MDSSGGVYDPGIPAHEVGHMMGLDHVSDFGHSISSLWPYGAAGNLMGDLTMIDSFIAAGNSASDLYLEQWQGDLILNRAGLTGRKCGCGVIGR
jgi:hypothetical protein